MFKNTETQPGEKSIAQGHTQGKRRARSKIECLALNPALFLLYSQVLRRPIHHTCENLNTQQAAQTFCQGHGLAHPEPMGTVTCYQHPTNTLQSWDSCPSSQKQTVKHHQSSVVFGFPSVLNEGDVFRSGL